jgi:ABC-type molybdate transport system permease subunit
MPVAIFFDMESGDTREALVWASIVLAISLAVLLAMGAWTRYQRAYLVRDFARAKRRPRVA